MPVPGGGKPSSTSSQSVFVARRSDDAYSSGSRAQPVRVDRVLRRLDAEVSRELADRAPVGEAGRDVRPLARIGALREEPAELVERRRRRAQDPVRVVVDEADRAQYFEK